MDEALFREHYAWAESIARHCADGLPPSFAVEDLKQEARIAHWQCCEMFDRSRGVPYRAFAYKAIYGAVMMKCRRKYYRENTHEELNGHHVDGRPKPDDAIVARHAGKLADRRESRKLRMVGVMMEKLPAGEAFLVRRIYLEGAEVDSMARLWGVSEERMNRKVKAAVAKLKKCVLTS